MAVRGYGTDVKGDSMNVRGDSMDVRGYGTDVRGYDGARFIGGRSPTAATIVSRRARFHSPREVGGRGGRVYGDHLQHAVDIHRALRISAQDGVVSHHHAVPLAVVHQRRALQIRHVTPQPGVREAKHRAALPMTGL
eukprot:901835-Prorocentrum_minimum.AAC.2